MDKSALPWGTFRPGRLAGALVWVSRTTPLGRGSLRRLLFAAFTRLHSGPVDTLLCGVPVRLHPGRNVSERKALMRPDRHDWAERAFLRAIVAQPHAVFIDIGANAGLYSLDAAVHAGEGGRIIAIEPNVVLLERLRVNEALAREAQRIEPSVTIEAANVAISDRDGEAYLAGHDEGSGGIGNADTGIPVKTRPLLGLLKDLGVGKIDALKIDIEGHEDRALVPFMREAPAGLLPRVLVIEHLSQDRWTTDCLAACDALGYRARLRTRNNTVFERDDARR